MSDGNLGRLQHRRLAAAGEAPLAPGHLRIRRPRLRGRGRAAQQLRGLRGHKIPHPCAYQCVDAQSRHPDFRQDQQDADRHLADGYGRFVVLRRRGGACQGGGPGRCALHGRDQRHDLDGGDRQRGRRRSLVPALHVVRQGIEPEARRAGEVGRVRDADRHRRLQRSAETANTITATGSKCRCNTRRG